MALSMVSQDVQAAMADALDAVLLQASVARLTASALTFDADDTLAGELAAVLLRQGLVAKAYGLGGVNGVGWEATAEGLRLAADRLAQAAEMAADEAAYEVVNVSGLPYPGSPDGFASSGSTAVL